VQFTANVPNPLGRVGLSLPGKALVVPWPAGTRPATVAFGVIW